MTICQDDVEITQLALALPNLGLADAYEDPISGLKEMHPYPITLLATFADCGTVWSGSRAVGRRLGKKSDFDLYQSRDTRALINLVSILDFASPRFNNRLFNQVRHDVEEFGHTIIPLEEFQRLARNVFQGENKDRGIKEYLESALKRAKISKKYGDLPESFDSALKLGIDLAEDKLIDSYIWVYSPGHDISKCIRQLEKEITDPFSKLLKRIPEVSHVKDSSLLEGIPDFKSVQRAIDAWTAEGYGHQLLRRWLRHKIIDIAPWLRDEVKDLLAIIFDVHMPEEQSTDAQEQSQKTKDKSERAEVSLELSYDWFSMLRSTLPNKIPMQLMVIPSANAGGNRLYGTLGNVLTFYATHTMGFISGLGGGHFYHDTTSKGISLKIDFTDNPKQKHAETGIEKNQKRGWKFQDMHKDKDMRSITDGKSAKLKSYEDIYRSALKEVGKGDEDLPDYLKRYLEERWYAVHSYTWMEDNGRIGSVRNSTKAHSHPTNHNILCEWVHDKLSGHKYVMPELTWKNRDLFKAKLDIWFGGFKQDWEDEFYYLV